VKVIILCGGHGTRIRDASEALPKPMLSIGERPILWHIMKGYASFGYKDFVLCLGYRGWVIKEFFLNYRAMTTDVHLQLGSGDTRFLGAHDESDWSVCLAETGERTMTGGRISAIRQYVEGDDLFLLTYGDGVADVNINELVEFHHSHGRVATVTAVRPPSRFGEMTTDGLFVNEFNEKSQTTEGFINGGFFVCDARRIWNYLADDPTEIFERGPLQQLTRDRQLAAYPHRGFWQPMDTLREYTLLNELWANGSAPWATWSGSNASTWTKDRR